MRILVIGGTGFIGSRVVRDLAAPGHQVTVLHRGRSTTPLPHGVRSLVGDRSLLATHPETSLQPEPDVIVDMILFTEQQARDLVSAARGRAGRLVAISSCDVYRNYDGLLGKAAVPDPVPLDENAPLRDTRFPFRGMQPPVPRGDDYDKILVEDVVRAEPALPATVLRLPAVYGPGDRQHRLRPYVQRMDAGRPAIFLGEEQAAWRWTRGYVDNVAAAIALAATDHRASGQTYNVGDRAADNELEWVQRIASAAGWSGRVVTLPALPPSMRQPLDWRFDLWISTRRIREHLGFRDPVPDDVAVEHAVAWERESLHQAEPIDYADEDALLRGGT